MIYLLTSLFNSLNFWSSDFWLRSIKLLKLKYQFLKRLNNYVLFIKMTELNNKGLSFVTCLWCNIYNKIQAIHLSWATIYHKTSYVLRYVSLD